MEVKDPYGFVYITTNLINGKRYIGAKKFDKRESWKNYLGSGVILENALKKYGKKNFIKEIISIHYSYQELFNAEEKLISFCNATHSDDYYNISDGQYSDNWAKYTKEEKEELSRKMKEGSIWNRTDKNAKEKQKLLKDKYSFEFSGEGNPFFGKHHADSAKEKISRSNKGKTIGDKNACYWKGKESPNKGKKMSLEAREKMRKSAKQRIENGKYNNLPYTITIVFNNQIYSFNSIKDSYNFCVINNLILNEKYSKPYIHIDTFTKHLKENYSFKLFDYTFSKN